MSSDFLTTVGIPMQHGRMFDEEYSERPTKNSPTQVVVNEKLVRQLFGAQDPLGKYFHLGDASGPKFEVIGVVGDAKYGNIREAIWPTVYIRLVIGTDPCILRFVPAWNLNMMGST